MVKLTWLGHATWELEGTKRVIIRLSQDDKDWVQLDVTDNGIGIAPEVQAKLFQFGFTTKLNGHGIGLHASILAAKEMGGSLTGSSKGLGTGATFQPNRRSCSCKAWRSVDRRRIERMYAWA